jgi:hypothetical protein
MMAFSSLVFVLLLHGALSSAAVTVSYLGDDKHILENEPIGTPIAYITIDYEGDDIACALDRDDIAVLQQLFDGEFLLLSASTFDAEDVIEYELILECRNHDSLIAREKIPVYIGDVNDNSPVISLSGTDAPFIVENAPPGTFVDRFSVNDADSGRNGEFSCKLSSYTNFLMVALYKNEYVIQTTRAMDREAVDSHPITVMCSDHGTPPRTYQLSFKVNVLDENDNPPKFTDTIYIFSVYTSDASVGIDIGALAAVDADYEDNARLSYSIFDEREGVCGDYFEIDRDSGLIRTKADVTEIKGRRCRMIAAATDLGTPQLSNQVTVIIHII